MHALATAQASTIFTTSTRDNFMSQRLPSLLDPQLALHLFEGDALGFWHDQ